MTDFSKRLDEIATEYAKKGMQQFPSARASDFKSAMLQAIEEFAKLEPMGTAFDAGFAAHDKQYAAEPLDDAVEKVRAIYHTILAAQLKEILEGKK